MRRNMSGSYDGDPTLMGALPNINAYIGETGQLVGSQYDVSVMMIIPTHPHCLRVSARSAGDLIVRRNRFGVFVY